MVMHQRTTVFPIPKNMYYTKLSNYRGIALSNTFGKV